MDRTGPGVAAAIASSRLLVVVVIDDASDALPLAAAVRAGGLVCIEVAMRTPAADVALRAIAGDPDLVVGAGTVLSVEQVDLAVDAGARYIVTPGFSSHVVRHCKDISVPVFPGVATATEVQMAMEAGIDTVKFFPAEPLGGVAMLNALAAPFGSIRFIPTGGITAASLPAYLAHPAVFAVGGSWMVAPNLIRSGGFQEITQLTAEAVSLVKSSRS